MRSSLKDKILEAVNPVDVFAHYIAKSTGQVLRLGKVMKSPLREEKHPSFNVFKGERGVVLYKDFAGHTGDMFDFVMKLFGVKFPDAIKIIASDFGISEKQDNGKFKFKRDLKAFPKLMIKEKPKFEYIEVPWDEQNLKYWERYGIRREVLEWYNVVPVNAFGGTTEEGTKWALYSTKDKEIYVYKYGIDPDGTEIVRMYRPMADKAKMEIKHLGNSSGKEIFGFDYLKRITGSKGVTTKQRSIVLCAGQKDALSLRAHNNCLGLALNSESCNLSQDLYLELMSRTNKLYVLYDNDATGELYANKLQKEFGIEKISLRELGYDGKDLSDFHEEYSKVPIGIHDHPLLKINSKLTKLLWDQGSMKLRSSSSKPQ